jgi:hypothetical protein
LSTEKQIAIALLDRQDSLKIAKTGLSVNIYVRAQEPLDRDWIEAAKPN